MPFVQAGDVKLHYVERGSGPEPLVFIHGYTSSLRAWNPILPRLSSRYRAFAFDLRGAGDSDKLPNGYGPRAYAEDIDIATRALGLDTFTIIGHSMGGVTAMQFAVLFPERLRRMVLVAPAPSGGIVVDPAIRAQMKAIHHNVELRRKMMGTLVVRPTSAAEIDRRIEDSLRWSDVALDEAWQAMADLRLSEDIARLQTPTLMVAGDRDTLRAANLEDAQRIPNCALHVFYRVGHEIVHDVPDEFVALLDDFVTYGPAQGDPAVQRAELIKALQAQAAVASPSAG